MKAFQQLQQAGELLQPFIGSLEQKTLERIVSFVSTQFYDVLLSSLQDDEKFAQEVVRQRPENSKTFIVRYILQNFNQYILLRLDQQLIQYAREFSQPLLVGNSQGPVDIRNNFITLFWRRDELYLDVGYSFFVLSFWNRLNELRLLIHHLDAQRSTEKAVQVEAFQSAESQDKKESNSQKLVEMLYAQNQLLTAQNNELYAKLAQANGRVGALEKEAKKPRETPAVTFARPSADQRDPDDAITLRELDIGFLKSQLQDE